MATSYDELTSSLADNSIEYDFVTELFSDGSAVEHDFYSRKDNIGLTWILAGYPVMEGLSCDNRGNPVRGIITIPGFDFCMA